MTDTTTTRPMLGDTLPKALEDWQALYVKTRGERDTAREAVDQIEQTRDDFGQQLIEARREIDRLRAVNAAQSDMLKGAALAAAEVTRERDALRKAVDDLAAEKTALTEMIRGMMEANAEAVDAPKVGDKVRISLTAFIPDDALFQQAQRDRAVLEVADYSPVPKLYVVLYAGRHMTFSAHELDVIEADHA